MKPTSSDRWARFRFLVVGPLLAAPPAAGELRLALAERAQRPWTHPISGVPVRFGQSTIERWYYRALATEDPIAALGRRPRKDRGRSMTIGARLAETIRGQYEAHPRWSVRLHHDNLAVVAGEDPSLGPLPSYPTRHFRHEDLLPIASRIRVRLQLGYLQPEQLLASLDHLLEQAGRPDLVTPELRRTLAEHAAGNLRILLNMANDLLDAAARRRLEQIDAKLYFELFNPKPAPRATT